MKIKNMKRNLVNAACIATAACTLAACGSSASSTTASSGATTTEASSAAEIKRRYSSYRLFPELHGFYHEDNG